VSVVALLVLGPERLPETLRTLGLWFGRMRRSFSAVKVEIEREIGMDEVRRQLHNEAILEEMRELESNVNSISQGLEKEVETNQETSIDSNEPSIPDATVDELNAAMRGLEANVKVVHTDEYEYSNEPHPDDESLHDTDGTIENDPNSKPGN